MILNTESVLSECQLGFGDIEIVMCDTAKIATISIHIVMSIMGAMYIS